MCILPSAKNSTRTRSLVLTLSFAIISVSSAIALRASSYIIKQSVPAQVYAGPDESASSAPVWPQSPIAPRNAPNVLLIMTDDIGFGASSTFGGPVATPAMEMLAKTGLRYTQFNTAAICSPTRASLLTGRNPHAVGMGHVENTAAGFDGYNSIIPKSSAFISTILKQNGYNTGAFGKWHLTPQWEQSQSGPYTRWPLGQGFENFFGFLASDNSMWNPTLTRDNSFVNKAIPQGYHFDEDMADEAINWIQARHANNPDKPFFAYYAPGTGHTPNHVSHAWMENYKGKFDSGWDVLRDKTFERQKALGVIPANTVLTERPKDLPAWNTLSKDQKRLYARYMEAWAGSIAHMDAQILRIVQSLKDSGQYDNTLIIYIQGDNGSSAEGGMNGLMFQQSLLNSYKEDFDYALTRIDDIGGPNLYNEFPAAWGWATNAPFKYYKQVSSYFGGTRNALVMNWPNGIRSGGGIRGQFHYVSDIMPTILKATGIDAPVSVEGVAQEPMDGVSMNYSFDASNAPSHRKLQVFEMVGSRGIYFDGWFASMKLSRQPWNLASSGLEDKGWELYDISKDFSQSNDLAAKFPKKLEMMKKFFWAEAGRNKIVPLLGANLLPSGRPSLGAGRTTFSYPQGVTRIPEDSSPHIIGESFKVSTTFTTQGVPSGVLIAQGGMYGGWSLYFKDGKLRYHQNALDPRRYTVTSDQALTAGRYDLEMVFTVDEHKRGSGGLISFSLNGKPAGSGRVPLTLGGWISHIEGTDIGVDTGTSVSPDYKSDESRFNGNFKAISLEILK